MKVALVQMNGGPNHEANLAEAGRLIDRAAEGAPRLVVLPECFPYLGGTPDGARAIAETLPGGPAWTLLRERARQHGIAIHGGSLVERDGDRLYNTSVVFGPDGRELARYRKMHLFDITAPDGTVYRESATYSAGEAVVTFELDGVVFGCAICFDIRFGGLFEALVDRGAQAIVLPAAFTLMTGKDHWEVLVRARAIETQCYLLAPNQVGAYEEEGETRQVYGHSMVVGPWGHVMARAEDRPGVVEAVLDIARVDDARAAIPVTANRRLPSRFAA